MRNILLLLIVATTVLAFCTKVPQKLVTNIQSYTETNSVLAQEQEKSRMKFESLCAFEQEKNVKILRKDEVKDFIISVSEIHNLQRICLQQKAENTIKLAEITDVEQINEFCLNKCNYMTLELSYKTGTELQKILTNFDYAYDSVYACWDTETVIITFYIINEEVLALGE